MPYGFLIYYVTSSAQVAGLVHIAVIVTVLDRGVERRRANGMGPHGTDVVDGMERGRKATAA